ncbi:MAG: hypothetical protein AAGN66_29160 [Acidobacteriota bacterium]
MDSFKDRQAVGLFVFSYLGFLTHVALEALMLHFSRELVDAQDWEVIVEQMTTPSTEWTMVGFSVLTLLPVFLSILARPGGGLWKVTAILGGLMTILHALHYVGELSEHFGAVGLASLVFHVLPSAWASWLAWQCSKGEAATDV